MLVMSALDSYIEGSKHEPFQSHSQTTQKKKKNTKSTLFGVKWDEQTSKVTRLSG